MAKRNILGLDDEPMAGLIGGVSGAISGYLVFVSPLLEGVLSGYGLFVKALTVGALTWGLMIAFYAFLGRR